MLTRTHNENLTCRDSQDNTEKEHFCYKGPGHVENRSQPIFQNDW